MSVPSQAPSGASAAGERRHYVAAFVLMVASLGVATWLSPHRTWFDTLGRPDYETLVPTRFGDWVEARTSNSGIISPTEGEELRQVYSQTVSRTYVNRASGRRIMLSIAYGDVQQGVMQIHRPESCYSSQGFQIGRVAPDRLMLNGRRVPVFRMTAVMGGRIEQVTYWIRVGDRLIDRAGFQASFARMRMGLAGVLADGLLFRVSEIDADARRSHDAQDAFIDELMRAVAPGRRAAFVAAGAL